VPLNHRTSKNLSNTIIAFVSYLENNPDSNVNLVVAGKRGWMDDNLILRNYPNRCFLQVLLKMGSFWLVFSGSCLLFIFFTFGLPARAMRCKTPIIFANNSFA
jgi:hypothetical protein